MISIFDHSDDKENHMTLQEFYAATGGGYEDALGRLHSERLVQKFVLKFLHKAFTV